MTETRAAAYGAYRCAQRLAELTDLPIQYEEIEALVALGMLKAADRYKGNPLYLIDDVDAFVDGDLLRLLMEARQWWFNESFTGKDAAFNLGWSVGELEQVTRDRGIRPGRWGRYARADIDALAADTDLNLQLHLGRRVDADHAAEFLEVRRIELDHLVAAGRIRPVHRHGKVCPDDQADVSEGLFTIADLEDVRADTSIDWETVRGVAKGKPSPLREFMPALHARADAIRALAARVSATVGATVTATWNRPRSRRGWGFWEFTWEPAGDGTPTGDTVSAAIAADSKGRRYRGEIALRPEGKR